MKHFVIASAALLAASPAFAQVVVDGTAEAAYGNALFEQAIGTARTRTKVMKRILATLLPMLPILITGLLASLRLSN